VQQAFDDFPAAERSHYCGPGGVEVMRGFIRQLRERSAQQAAALDGTGPRSRANSGH